VRGVGSVALVLAGGGSWAAVTWDDLHVVEAAPHTAGDETANPDALTSTTSPTSPSGAAPAAPPPPPPPAFQADCSVADEPAEGDPTTDWATVVVDRQHGLPADYVPADLVDVVEAGFGDGEGAGDKVREIVVDDLAALRQAAEDNGTPLVLVSAYRSYDYQARLFEEEVAANGREQAELSTALPGHSEHQLGTTIDLLDTESASLEAAFASTPAGRWLTDNAHRYGFVISYPDVPVERSCYGFEPWHLRYVGRDIARDIVESGLTPREWMLAHG
jgi:zinc D-Ala-D-Ala carboxypeptidase